MLLPILEDYALAVARALLFLGVYRTSEVFSGRLRKHRTVSECWKLAFTVFRARLFEFLLRIVKVRSDQWDTLRFAVHAELSVVAFTTPPKSTDFALAAV